MTTGLDVFDTTVQKTNHWLNRIERDPAVGENRRRSYLVLRGTLHALRDELIPEEAVQLGAQLPMLIRGFYYEGWDPWKTPVRERSREAFLKRVEELLMPAGGVNAERAVRTVFEVMTEEMDQGELTQVRGVLPKSVRSLWPEPPPPAQADVAAEAGQVG
jgi:uncharacterized protein (DUF2267 family)